MRIVVVELILQDSLSLAATQLRMSLLLSLKKLIIINLKIIKYKNSSVDEISRLLEDYNVESEELQTDFVLLNRYKNSDLLLEDPTRTKLIEKRISRLKKVTELVDEMLEDKKEQRLSSFNGTLKFDGQGHLVL